MAPGPADLKNTAKKAAYRGGALVSRRLDPATGPDPWRHLVGRARLVEARRLLANQADPAVVEQLVTPLLEGQEPGSPLTSRAWAMLGRVRQRQGNAFAAVEATRRAVAAEPVAFEALVLHHRLTAVTAPDEAAEARRRLLEVRPRNRREIREVLAELRKTDLAAVDAYAAALLGWDYTGYEEYLDEVRWEIRVVAAGTSGEHGALEAAVAAATDALRNPTAPLARALDQVRGWELLAAWVERHPMAPTAALGLLKPAGTELRKAAARALTAGYTRAAQTLAAHALAARPDDTFAQETWANATDQLAVVRSGWRSATPAAAPKHQPREGAVLSVLAQSLPHMSGGYATRTHGVLTGLVRQGWDVQAVTRLGFPYDRWAKGDTRTVPAYDDVDGVRYHRVLTGARTYPQYPLEDYVARYADAIEKRARLHGASLVHASSFHVNGLAGQRVAAKLGVPFLYEMRGLEELMKVSRDPHFATSDRYRFTAGLETEICHAADKVFVITHALKELMADRGVDPDKMVVLPNGVHAHRFEARPRDPELEAALGVAGKTVIGYAGGLVDYEGLDLLLQAVAMLRDRRGGDAGADFHVIIVGDGHFESRLHALADRLRLGSVLTFTGRVPHEEVARYLSLFDVAPFPRLPLPVCEAISPIKPFESMAMGKACLTSSVAALTEIVTDGKTGLVFEKGSAEDLAAKIEAYVESPELRREMGTAAREWVRAERDWANIVTIVEDTYRTLV